MRKPGTDETNVQMSDVICDFCHREWTEDLPMIEGHQGSCICGRCVSAACAELVAPGEEGPSISGEFRCPMCLETGEDRAALGRAGEGGWRSPAYPDAAICGRCIELAATALEKDKDWKWMRPGGHEQTARAT